MRPAAQRSCGPCSACCEFPAIESLRKPASHLCCHAGAPGCAIYPERPVECRDYTCLWLDGELADGDRPDQIGLAFDLPSRVQDHPDYEGVHAICARELWPGARAGTRAAGLLSRLARALVVRLSASVGKTELTGPLHSIELLVERASARRAAER